MAVDLEAALNVVQQGALGLIIGGAEALGALKHEVLKVVRQTRGFGRVVLAAALDGHVTLYVRLFVIDGQVHLQAVVQRVDAGLQRVACHAVHPILWGVFGLHAQAEGT